MYIVFKFLYIFGPSFFLDFLILFELLLFWERLIQIFYNSNLKLHSIQKYGIIFYFRSPRFKLRWKWLLPSKQCCNCCKMGQKRRKSSENSYRWFGCAPWTINSIQFLWRSKCFIFLHTQVNHIVTFLHKKRMKK